MVENQTSEFQSDPFRTPRPQVPMKLMVTLRHCYYTGFPSVRNPLEVIEPVALFTFRSIADSPPQEQLLLLPRRRHRRSHRTPTPPP